MNDSKTLAQAATDFLASLQPGQRKEHQQELNKFVRWYGMERPLHELSGQEVEAYAKMMEGSSSNATERLAPVKAFLSHAKKEGLTRKNLSVHLRVKKSAAAPRSRGARGTGPIQLTAEGYRELEAELAALEAERPAIAEEIRKAAADKDVRENAPLEAAREHQGMVEARIRQLEATLKAAVITEGDKSSARAALGSSVVLIDLKHNEELRYILVNPREASPAKGKLSVASPTGKALLGCKQDEVIEVDAPAGKLRYRIARVEN